MKYALLILMFVTLPALAKIAIKPGLWKVDMTIVDANGKETNMNKQMSEAMAKLPPEQKKQLEAMMKKKGMSAPVANLSEICYTQKMIDDPKVLSGHKDNCQTKVLTQTPTKMASTFTCKDGTKGTVNFRVKNSESYEGVIKSTSPEGKSTTMTQKAQFLSESCGDVKPLKI